MISGEDLFMRFAHESNRVKPERRIRPGFSPTRYISTWSKYWNDCKKKMLFISYMLMLLHKGCRLFFSEQNF